MRSTRTTGSSGLRTFGDPSAQSARVRSSRDKSRCPPRLSCVLPRRKAPPIGWTSSASGNMTATGRIEPFERRRATAVMGGRRSPDGATILDADSASESLHGTIWRWVYCGLRLQSGLAGDLRAGVHEPTYRSRSPCADYRAYWEYGGARLGCQADHRSPVKRSRPRRGTIKLRGAASGVGLCLHATVRGPVARRAFLPEGTFRAMDTPPPYFARRPSPVAAPPSVS